MRNFWIVLGSEANWRQAFASKAIWGLQDKTHDRIYWLALAANDVILFYVTGKIKGIVGYGIVSAKFVQDSPLWKDEISQGRAIWPLRFEFDIEFILPENQWNDLRVPIPGGGVFRQPLFLRERREVEPIIQSLNPGASLQSLLEPEASVQRVAEEMPSPTHDAIKEQLVEIGRLQSFVVNPEYPMGSERLDVVWRRLPESVPTYVFEVQVGGDLYHALAKLKHARDIWNSRIFLVAGMSNLGAVNQLLTGTFHEIQPALKFIDILKIQDLHVSKRNIYKLEKELGIIA